MEGKRRPIQRALQRTHVVTRLEAQLWALAYEQLRSPAVPAASAASTPLAARPRSARPRPAAFARGA